MSIEGCLYFFAYQFFWGFLSMLDELGPVYPRTPVKYWSAVHGFQNAVSEESHFAQDHEDIKRDEMHLLAIASQNMMDTLTFHWMQYLQGVSEALHNNQQTFNEKTWQFDILCLAVLKVLPAFKGLMEQPKMMASRYYEHFQDEQFQKKLRELEDVTIQLLAPRRVHWNTEVQDTLDRAAAYLADDWREAVESTACSA
ncbi:MAG: hypothetical protein JXB07_11915 [Anaerolineae bacterium]|nr:hypothetical protein [Anaerolineae bacterium]